MLLAPEAILSAGFQMSFAATVALVAGYQRIAPLRARVSTSLAGRGGGYRILFYAAGFLSGLIATALLAGLATAPISAFYFNRIAAYGLLANILAMPVVSFVVMPAGMLALLMMPLGLETVPLAAMDAGLRAVEAIAGFVAGLPGAAVPVPSWPGLSLVLVVAAAGIVTLFARPPWLLAGILALAGGTFAFTAERPDILVNETGSLIAVRGEDGRLGFLRDRGSNFVEDRWLASDGDIRQSGDPTLGQGRHCDREGCTMVTVDRTTGKQSVVANSVRPSGLARDCRNAAVIVTRYRPTDRMMTRCGSEPGIPLVITPADLATKGAHAIRIRGDGPASVSTVRDPESRRPWQRPTAGDQ